MLCPTLADLPAPPPGKSGWPWTEESPRVPEHLPDGSPWPRVSVITPSLNQGKFIEETIRSVLLQGYPDLEYIIIDGGSTDDSLEVIRKYEPWLAYWVSEPDGGPACAIAKGVRNATGEILAWLNSDDTYQPNAIAASVSHLTAHPKAAAVFGDCYFVDGCGRRIGEYKGAPFDWRYQLFSGNSLPQPTVLMWHERYAESGGVNTKLHYVFDYELWFRLVQCGNLEYFPGFRANYRLWDNSFTVARPLSFLHEKLQVFKTLSENRDLDASTLQLIRWAMVNVHLNIARYAIGNCEWSNAEEHLNKARDVCRMQLWPKEWCRSYAQIVAGLAFAAYSKAKWENAIRHGISAVCICPSLLANRGFLVVLVKSAWNLMLHHSVK
jgi:glycosyltransferase involved in cell wall biosynthesis